MNWSHGELRKMANERYRVAQEILKNRKAALKMRCYSDRRLIVALANIVGGTHGKT